MKQPKYKFGDMFQCPVSTIVQGVRLSGTATYYVCAIMVVNHERNYDYKYKLTTNLPVDYWVDGVVETDWMLERIVEKVYTHVPF